MMNWIISSSILIVLVIAIRFFLKGKISLRLQYGLWALVLVRLLFPFSIGETVISIGNWVDSVTDTKKVQQVIELTQTPLPSMSYNEAYDIVEEEYAQEGIDIEKIPAEEFSETVEYEIIDTMNGGYTIAEILKIVWIVGVMVLIFCFFASNLHFFVILRKNRVYLGRAGELMQAFPSEVKLDKEGNLLPVYQSNVVETPCLYGIFSPTIYVTEEVIGNKECLLHVLEHESTHYHHWDYLWSILRVICAALHWYNPLVWCAAFLSRNDAELACDEATIERLGEAERASYGRTLIGLTCEKRPAVLLTATTMTGSGRSIKERIALIAKKPKMAVLTIVLLVLLLQVVIGWTFTGAKQQYASFSEWAAELSVENFQYLHVSNGYTSTDRLYYYLSEEEGAQLCELLKSIPEEDCYRRSEWGVEYESYQLFFKNENKDVVLYCLEDGTIRVTGDSELPNFAPEGKALYIDCPELWNYIVDTVDEKGHPETESNSETSTEKIEQCIYDTTADLNHDGYDDLVEVVMINPDDRKYYGQDIHGTFIQIFLGKEDGTYDSEAVYTSEKITETHAGNGTFVLSEKDGKDYLIYSLMYEMQGGTHYEYSVMRIEETEMVTVHKDKVGFECDPYNWYYWEGTHREDVIPQFKKGMEPWIENGIILVSYDVQTPSFISSKSIVIPAFTYYDLVWARSEAEQIESFEREVGTEEWQQSLYWSSSTYFDTKEWIEAQLATDYSIWYGKYDGSKLQRLDNCVYKSNTVGCGVPASCDVIFYRAGEKESIQDVLYKMIEKMIQARMEPSKYRPYVITDYAIPEQDVIQISEDMWMIKSLEGYYAYEGTDMGTMQEIIDSGVEVTEDGLIPFVVQGSEDAFIHILIEKDGVYRLQRLQKMMK